MKAKIHCIKGHTASVSQAEVALESFNRYGWDAELVEGCTPQTIDPEEGYLNSDLKGGRLESFRSSEPPKYDIKKACFINHVRHWRRVLEANEPMAFVEHDAICTGKPPNLVTAPYVFLAYETALNQGVFAGRADLRNYKIQPSLQTISPFPDNYPLRYYKESIYKGAIMTPGTVAYIVNPVGAMKLLDAIQRYGIEQSDFHINSHNVKMSYMYPSPVKYNKNLNTSHTL